MRWLAAGSGRAAPRRWAGGGWPGRPCNHAEQLEQILCEKLSNWTLLRIRDVDPGSEFFSIPDPNFSIPDQNFSIPDPGSASNENF
jgi:hypothetical protein